MMRSVPVAIHLKDWAMDFGFPMKELFKRNQRPRRILLASLILIGGGIASQPEAATTFAGVLARDQPASMHRGINVMDGDPVWDHSAPAWFGTEKFALVHDAGFDTVRINLHAFAHLDASGQLDTAWLATLDRYTHVALAEGLTVVLDMHDDISCDKDIAACKRKLPQVWSQIANRYRNEPPKLLFELLNEPHGTVTAEIWNGLLRDTLKAIRKTNPMRAVVIGPAGYSSVEQLPTLDLPESDRHIIVTVHYYWPTRFTHQGVPWLPELQHLSGITFGSDEQKAKIAQDFDKVEVWGKVHKRPIFLGEFGTYEKGDLESRLKYLSTVARAAESRGFAWALWEFETDFAAYDMKREQWNAPILRALIPSK
jgi:endoglucanase